MSVDGTRIVALSTRIHGRTDDALSAAAERNMGCFVQNGTCPQAHWAAVAQSVWRLAADWTVGGSEFESR